MRALLVLLLSLAVGVAAAAQNDSALRPEISEAEAASARAIRDMEQQMAELRALPPGERERREAKLGRALEKLADKCHGNKYQNTALYWLAAWRLTYAGGERA